MPEHRIRFRGGWELGPIDGDPGEVRRLTLPVDWPGGGDGPIRLTRRFGRPPIDPVAEPPRLELRGVPGLRGLHLNGLDLGPIPDGVVDWTAPLGDLLEARNTLTLTIDPALISPGEAPAGWGWIALVIAPKVGPFVGRVE